LALAPSLLSQAATTLLEPLLANVVGELGINNLRCGIGPVSREQLTSPASPLAGMD
jgi:hypothetical protein